MRGERVKHFVGRGRGSRLVTSLNRSLSLSLPLWLCPSQLVAINHLKWTALTGSWLHHSLSFFPFFFSSSSNCCLIYCLLPHLLKSPPPGPNPHPQWQSGRVSNQNKQSPICLIETFEVVKSIKPPPSFLCSNWGWDRKTCNGCNEQWCHRNSSWLISSTRALSMWAALVHLHVHVRPLANVSTWSKWLIYTWGSPAEWGWAPYKQQIAQRSVVKAGWVQ